MSWILNIDTAMETGMISIAHDGVVQANAVNKEQKDHAAFLQPAIRQVMLEAGMALHAIDAIAVTAGPGSYTGLRVGMASAKGLCYALQKPLITLTTLECMAAQMQMVLDEQEQALLLCPMIDARRLEVFTALYDVSLNVILEPTAMVLEPDSYITFLQKQPVLFFGSGAAKWKALSQHAVHAHFREYLPDIVAMSRLSFQRLQAGVPFVDLAYTEPLYIKSFYAPGLPG